MINIKYIFDKQREQLDFEKLHNIKLEGPFYEKMTISWNISVIHKMWKSHFYFMKWSIVATTNILPKIWDF
jgi:hypothetical protein